MADLRKPTEPSFWRDDTLPFVEGRSIRDGRKVCYARHAHETFSIGIISNGYCMYLNGRTREPIGPGTVVLMNPGDVHACNPIRDEPWSYRMLYLDVAWLADIQRDLGVTGDRFRLYSATWTSERALYKDFNHFFDLLTDSRADHLQKESAAVAFVSAFQSYVTPMREEPPAGRQRLARAADFIRANYSRPIKLREISSEAGLSDAYLIRAFKEEYGMTPHEYVVNCRVEFSRSQLRRGRPIAEVAAAAGFADQAHLQRTFRKIVAATPGQYRAT